VEKLLRATEGYVYNIYEVTFRPLCPLHWRFWRYLRQVVLTQAVECVNIHSL